MNTKVKIESKARVLEIGSGIGGFYSLLKDKDYTGIDLDKQAVQFTNRHFKANCFKNISFENFKTNKKFDYVFAFEVLEHFKNPLASLEKIHRLLNRKGVFCGTTPFPFVKNIEADKTHLYILHPANWKKLFVKSGFNKVEFYPMSFSPLLWRFNKNINVRIPFYISLPFFISTTLIVARKT